MAMADSNHQAEDCGGGGNYSRAGEAKGIGFDRGAVEFHHRQNDVECHGGLTRMKTLEKIMAMRRWVKITASVFVVVVAGSIIWLLTTIQWVSTACRYDYVLGCSLRDPIDRLEAELSKPQISTHLYQPIELPETASPQECISVLASKDRRLLLSPKVLKMRQVHISIGDWTAVLLDTNDGQKIVLLQFLPPKVSSKGGMHGWDYWIYDAK